VHQLHLIEHHFIIDIVGLIKDLYCC